LIGALNIYLKLKAEELLRECRVNMSIQVPIARTSLLAHEVESVLEPLKTGWLVQGPKVKEFEQKWSAFTGARHSIAVTSCTTALHLSLAAIDFQPGDEAIVPAFTWVATANVVEHLGGKVVFCDIDPSSFNIDVEQLKSKISARTKAILPVHLFGLAADMNSIMAVAKQYQLALIEDAACGFGTLIDGKHVGTFGVTGAFSFHPRKAITTGEGGMITTDDDALAEKLRQLRDHGAAMSDLQRHLGARPYLLADHPHAGYNQRMTDIQAALGSSQMDRATAIIQERQRLAERYNEAFASLSWLKTPTKSPSMTHSYQSYPCYYMPEKISASSIGRIHAARNQWMEELQRAGISTRPATHAVHMLSYYSQKYSLQPSDFPNAHAANDCSISLPLFHGMTQVEQDYVIQQVLRHRP
jgi:perosamine synthetase